MSYPHLSSKGGVTLVPKAKIPAVIHQVGFTANATAMLIIQQPGDLGLASYPHSRVDCTILLPDIDGAREVRVTRWCVQLGFTAQVPRIAECPSINIPVTKVRMVCKQREEFGWPAQARASNVTTILERHDISMATIGVSAVG